MSESASQSTRHNQAKGNQVDDSTPAVTNDKVKFSVQAQELQDKLEKQAKKVVLNEKLFKINTNMPEEFDSHTNSNNNSKVPKSSNKRWQKKSQTDRDKRQSPNFLMPDMQKFRSNISNIQAYHDAGSSAKRSVQLRASQVHLLPLQNAVHS